MMAASCFEVLVLMKFSGYCTSLQKTTSRL